MSMRIRNIPGVGTIAVCAARSMPLPDDIYLDDNAHHALSIKFERDFVEMGFLERDFTLAPAEGVEDIRPIHAAMDAAESNNPNRDSWDVVYGGGTDAH